MSDIANTLVDLLAVAKLEIRKLSAPDDKLEIHAHATPIGGGGRHEHSEVVEHGDEEATLRRVLLELKGRDYPAVGDYPRQWRG